MTLGFYSISYQKLIHGNVNRTVAPEEILTALLGLYSTVLIEFLRKLHHLTIRYKHPSYTDQHFTKQNCAISTVFN